METTAGKKYHVRGIGAIIGAISGLFYSSGAALTKLMTGTVDVRMVTWSRFLMVFLATSIMVIIKRQKPWKLSMKDLFIMTVVSFLSLTAAMFQNYSLQMVPISNALTLISSFPVFVVVILFVCFCQRPRFVDCLTIISSMIGIVLCTKPQFLFPSKTENNEGNALGNIFALITAFSTATICVLMKQMNHVNKYTVMFLHVVFSFVALTIYMFIAKQFDNPMKAIDVVFVGCHGLFAYIAQIFFILAIKVDVVEMFSIGRASQIVVSLIFNTFLFNEPIDYLMVLGIFIVLVSIVTPSCLSLYQKRM